MVLRSRVERHPPKGGWGVEILAAVCAPRHNPAVKDFYELLLAYGKPKKRRWWRA
jgi:hypothetical protein